MICHICGKEIKNKLEKSREHVPPESFFPDIPEQKINLLTVPSHVSCNTRFKKMEEKFCANYLAPAESPEMSQLFMDNNLGPSFKHKIDHIKSIIDKKALNKSIYEMNWGEWEYMKQVKLFRSGNENVAAVPLNGRVEFEDVIWKICQGLYFFEHTRYLKRDLMRKVSGPYSLIRSPRDVDFELDMIREKAKDPNFKVDDNIILNFKENQKPNLNPDSFKLYITGIKRKKNTFYQYRLEFLRSLVVYVDFTVTNYTE